MSASLRTKWLVLVAMTQEEINSVFYHCDWIGRRKDENISFKDLNSRAFLQLLDEFLLVSIHGPKPVLFVSKSWLSFQPGAIMAEADHCSFPIK